MKGIQVYSGVILQGGYICLWSLSSIRLIFMFCFILFILEARQLQMPLATFTLKPRTIQIKKQIIDIQNSTETNLTNKTICRGSAAVLLQSLGE